MAVGEPDLNDPEPKPIGSTASVASSGAHATPSAILFTPGTEIDGRYQVRDVLGTGGFSVVYRAWDRELKHEIALKVLRSDRFNASTLERFRREARVAREAAGPGLVRVFDIGRSRQTLYLPMELVDGETLKARLAKGSLPIEEVVSIGMQILEALHDLHRLGIVHRDVKPSNVLLGRDGAVKLADFGLAFRMDGSGTRVTRTDALVGTVEYLSPEQALGEGVDERSDLYSFGVLLFEMLAGRLPYQRESSLGTLVARLGEQAPDVRQLRPETPRWLGRTVDRLMQRRKDERYGSARAALDDLKRRRSALGWSRRRWTLGTGVASVLVVAVAALTPLLFNQPSTQFSHLVRTPGGVAAVDRSGQTMWSRSGIDLSYPVVARLEPSGPQRIVGIFADKTTAHAEALRRLTILDPETGTVEREIDLPSAASHFPGFSDRFGAVVQAVDLDGDGADEILTTHLHDPYWPSYVVLFEPLINRARVIFVGSGHHYVGGTRDLDGDGRKEILLLGINNLMGWYNALAAVQLRPWVNAEVGIQGLPVVSPDRNHAESIGNDALWYALLPSGRCVDRRHCLDVGREDSSPIGVRLDDGKTILLDPDGFVVGSGEALSPRRQEARHDAYRRLGEAERLRSVSFLEDALAEAELAVVAATDARDEYLLEWVLRSRARMLIDSGAAERAEREFSDLMGSYERSTIAFDAGKAFHLRGDLERAATWYRTGLGPGGSFARGRVKNEFIQGLALALGEAGRWDEARDEIERFGIAYPHQLHNVRVLEEYARWRNGAPPDITRLAVEPSSNDLDRYLLLEFRLARGEAPAGLMDDVELELTRSSESIPMLLSFEGELLDRLGRAEEAAASAARAYDLALLARETDFTVRALFDLIAARHSRLVQTAS